MPFQIMGKRVVVSDSEVISAEQGIEDIYMWKACIVLRETRQGTRDAAKALGEVSWEYETWPILCAKLAGRAAASAALRRTSKCEAYRAILTLRRLATH